MDRMLYLAMVGAQQTMKAQGVSANNLANVNTTGFRRDLEAFATAPMQGPGHASRAYGVGQGHGIDTTAGSIQQTGNPLDVAISGQGWLAVQADDGTEGYTRAGNLRANANGQLTTAAGNPVLGNGGPIALPPHESVEIAQDGTISVRPRGAPANVTIEVDRLRLVNPDPAGLSKGGDGLIRMAGDEEPAADANVQVVAGALESSNVNAVDAMVRQIELARRFEMQMKMMSAARDTDQASDRLLRRG
jgi:flagellar basal-body rod protein FlgF